MSDQPEQTRTQTIAAAASNAAFQLGMLAGALMRHEKEGDADALDEARAAFDRADQHMQTIEDLMGLYR